MRRSLFLLLISIALFPDMTAQTSRLEIVGEYLGKSYTQTQVRQFLIHRYSKLLPAGSGLDFIQKKESPAASHFSYQQNYKGIPLYGTELKVHIDKKGKIRAIQENLQKIPPQKLPDFRLAESSLKQRMAESYGAYQSEIKAMLLLEGSKLKPVYRIENQSHGPIFSFEVLIDAQTGTELQWQDLGLYHRHPLSDSTGRGRVFLPNPCTKANVNYGDTS